MPYDNRDRDPEKSLALEQHSIRFRRGTIVPSHMALPGEDQFRTPTVGYYEHHPNHTQHLEHPQEGHKSPFAHIHFPPTPEASGSVRSRRASTAPSHLSLQHGLDKLDEKLAWKERLKHFTWTFFSLNMATGGIANVLYSVPFRFDGIQALGTIFFLFNIGLFIINIICISLRFHFHPGTFKASFLHPTESLFVPAAVVSFGTILINISQYGLHYTGPWLDTVVLALFWFDVALAVISSSGIYLLMWSTQTFTIAQMTPIWIFPAYPLLIVGPHAGILAGSLDPMHAADIIVGGFTVQGIGYMVTLMIYSAFIYRLMTQKLPKEGMRPGMFVSVGPSGFTAGALISMASNAERAFGADFMGNGPLAAMIIKVVANWAALWLWGLAVWFFFVAVGAHYSCMGKGGLKFAMTWFSFVFPNTALITATFAVGRAFNSMVIQMLGCVFTCILIVVWTMVFCMMIRGICLKQILWPQKGEDKDEGGFKASQTAKATPGDLWHPNGATTNPV